MKDYHDWNSIQAETPTICPMVGIFPPALSTNLTFNSPSIESWHQAKRLPLNSLSIIGTYP
jgi:hypothetical protein